jgi:hypothetical protein
MITADDIMSKLNEINALIRKNINADGSFRFDPNRVMVSLELARRMAEAEPMAESAEPGKNAD